MPVSQIEEAKAIFKERVEKNASKGLEVKVLDNVSPSLVSFPSTSALATTDDFSYCFRLSTGSLSEVTRTCLRRRSTRRLASRPVSTSSPSTSKHLAPFSIICRLPFISDRIRYLNCFFNIPARLLSLDRSDWRVLTSAHRARLFRFVPVVSPTPSVDFQAFSRRLLGAVCASAFRILNVRPTKFVFLLRSFEILSDPELVLCPISAPNKAVPRL